MRVLRLVRQRNKYPSAPEKLRDNGSVLAIFGEAFMKGLLVQFACISAALLWVCFVGPWIARLCGIPVRAAFWTMNQQNQHLTRFQFVWAFGVLVYGVGMFIFSLAPDTLQRILLEKRWSAKLADLGFSLAITVFMGILIGFWCAPTQTGESSVTGLDLSRRQ
jgi:hypothetical protein